MININKSELLPLFAEWSGVFTKSSPFYHFKRELEEKHFDCSITDNQFVQLFLFKNQVFSATLQSVPFYDNNSLKNFLSLVDLNDYHSILRNIRLCLQPLGENELKRTQSNGPRLALLGETNGWILYDYQLSYIYRFATDENYEKANTFVKGWNEKVQSVINEAEMYIINGNNLGAILRDAIPNDNAHTRKTPHLEAIALLSLIYNTNNNIFLSPNLAPFEDDEIISVNLERFENEEWDFISKILTHNLTTPLHGKNHVFRTILAADLLITADRDQYYGNEINRFEVFRVAAFHDAGRTGDGEDLWEDESAFLCYSYLLHCGYDKNKAKELSDCILNKNSEVLEYPISRVLHDADCIEITRIIQIVEFEKEKLWLYREAKKRENDYVIWAIDAVLRYILVRQNSDFELDYNIETI